MKQYIIKLQPSKDRIVVGAIVNLRGTDKNFIVLNNIEQDIQIEEGADYVDGTLFQLMKYYIIYRGNIIGELSFTDYDKYSVDNNIKVKMEDMTSRVILNKPEIGDTVVLTRVSTNEPCNDLVTRFTNTGTIIKLNNRNADIDIGTTTVKQIKRYRYEIISSSDKPKPDKKIVFSIRKE